MTFFIGKCLLLALKLAIVNHYFYDFDIYQSPSSAIPSDIITGENEKNLLVVLKALDFTEENKSFLSKILSAVKYDMARDASVIVLPEDEDFAINTLLHANDFKNVLVFGMNPKDIGLSIETFLYAPFEISNMRFIVGHPLEKIKISTEYKKNLWTALQAIFI